MSVRVVQAVTFGDDDVVIQYMTLPDDVRNKGLLVMTRSLVISEGDEADYVQEIADLKAAALALLNDALEDFATTEPLEMGISSAESDANEGWQGLEGEYDDEP